MNVFKAVAVIAALTSVFTAGAIAAEPKSGSGKIEVVDAWARMPTEGARTTTAYVEIANRADAPDRLISVSSPLAERASLATYVHEGYDMKMKTVYGLNIKARGRLTMRANETFIYLESLAPAIRGASVLPLTLRFEKGGTVEVQAQISNQLLRN